MDPTTSGKPLCGNNCIHRQDLSECWAWRHSHVTNGSRHHIHLVLLHTSRKWSPRVFRYNTLEASLLHTSLTQPLTLTSEVKSETATFFATHIYQWYTIFTSSVAIPENRSAHVLPLTLTSDVKSDLALRSAVKSYPELAIFIVTAAAVSESTNRTRRHARERTHTSRHTLIYIDVRGQITQNSSQNARIKYQGNGSHAKYTYSAYLGILCLCTVF